MHSCLCQIKTDLVAQRPDLRRQIFALTRTFYCYIIAQAEEEGKEAEPVAPVMRTVSKDKQAWQIQNSILSCLRRLKTTSMYAQAKEEGKEAEKVAPVMRTVSKDKQA